MHYLRHSTDHPMKMIKMICDRCGKELGYFKEAWEGGGGHSFYCLGCIVVKRTIRDIEEVRERG